MSKFVAISRERHAGKRWRRADGYLFAAGDAVVPVVGAELFRAVLAMPVAFIERSGGYELVAVLSFTRGRNMFVGPDGRWLGSYVPAWYRGYPFRLLQPEGAAEMVLCIDEDSKLIVDGTDPGEEFFAAAGGPAGAVKPIFDTLSEIERNRKATRHAVAALADAGVIEPWPITLKTQEAARPIGGLHRIDEAKLNALDDDAFLRLRKAAALPLAYMQLLSKGQLVTLEYLAKLQAQLAQTQATRTAIANLPESIDSLFGMVEDDTVQFR